MFAGNDLSCARGPRLLFTGLDFAVEPGGALVLTGPNGSGKSTLLRLMAGLIRPLTGGLTWKGEPLHGSDQPASARLAFLGYHDAIKPALSVQENLTFWAALADPSEAAARARLALKELGLGDLADLPGRYLSSGQRRRLAIARLLVSAAPLWLLDEPTVALDTDGVGRLASAIARHRNGGGMIVLATHAEMPLPGSERLQVADYAPAAGALEDSEAASGVAAEGLA